MNKRKFLRKILQNKDFFFFMFAEHLDEVFFDDWYEVDNESDNNEADVCVMVGGTNGWYKAFKLACEELCIEDCFKYYKSLSWEESDVLDVDLMYLLEAVVFDEEGNRIRGIL